MKQVLQNLKDGNTIVADVPVPTNKKNHLIISSSLSLTTPLYNIHLGSLTNISCILTARGSASKQYNLISL